MEMNRRSTASYLVHTPHVPFFMLILVGLEAHGALSFPGATWDRFRCTVEPSPGHIRCRCWQALQHIERSSRAIVVCIAGPSLLKLPSDTKLLLTKNYSEIIIFEKLRISYVISGKSHSFPEILRAHSSSKITKNNSQGIIFVIISCQRVFEVILTNVVRSSFGGRPGLQQGG